MRGGDHQSLPGTMVTMSPCHNVTVSTYLANPIVVFSVFNLKKAYFVLRLHCELDLLQDVLGTLSLMVCPLPARRQAGGPSVSQADPQHDPPDLLLSHPVLLMLQRFLFLRCFIQPAVFPQPRFDLRSFLGEAFKIETLHKKV